jgi:hypothetical protein
MTPRHRARHARSLTVVVTLLQVADVCSICCFADWCAFFKKMHKIVGVVVTVQGVVTF